MMNDRRDETTAETHDPRGPRVGDRPPRGVGGTTWKLIEEVLCTATALEEVVSGLLEDLPQGTFPGEDNARVVLEMVVGSVMPATAAAGEEACRQATALVAAVRERVLVDLHTAVELAAEERR